MMLLNNLSKKLLGVIAPFLVSPFWLLWRFSALFFAGQSIAGVLVTLTLLSPVSAAPLLLPENLLTILESEGSKRLIVGLNLPFKPEGELSPQEITSQRESIAQSQTKFLQEFNGGWGSFGMLTMVPSIKVERKFVSIPFMVVEADYASAMEMVKNSSIVSLEIDAAHPATLSESTKVIGADVVWEQGYSGAGQQVAVLDTGVDKTHPDLKNQIVSEACFSTTSPSYSAKTVCPKGSESLVGKGAGVPCSKEVHGCSHGTHVAGIVAANGPSVKGVAKDAGIVAIQVFSRFDNPKACGAKTPCALSFTSDQIAALEHVLQLHKSGKKIAAANMSLGSGSYSTPCMSSIMGIINHLRSIGIATIAASGNEGYTDGIGMPACVSSAISVGATSKAKIVASYSNSAEILDVLAPGSGIVSTLPDGKIASNNGTSQATPHVAGAWAVLKSAAPEATVDKILQVLKQTGHKVKDPRNGIKKPFINLAKALNKLAKSKGSKPSQGEVGVLGGEVGISSEVVVPSLTIRAPSKKEVVTGSGVSVSYSVTYSEADTVNLIPTQITLQKTGTVNAALKVTQGTTKQPIVTLSDIVGEGTLGIIIKSGTALNSTGQSPAESSASFKVVGLVINELDVEQPGPGDSAEFIEIKNISNVPINLGDYHLELINGSGLDMVKMIGFDNINLAAQDYYVICANGSNVVNCDQDLSSSDTDLISNDNAAAAVLRLGDFIVDSISYGTKAGSDNYTEGRRANPDSATEAHVSLSRFPDGKDSHQNHVDFSKHCITPGLANDVAKSSNCYQLSINDVSTEEGDFGSNTVEFTVTLNHEAPFDISVNYATADDSANADSDYVAIAATPLTFSAGETSQTIEVAIKGDPIDENDETFLVNLTQVSAGATLADNQGVGTILNDDTIGVMITSPLSVEEKGTTTATYSVQLKSEPSANVQVNLSHNDQCTVTPTSLTFTDQNWSASQTVTVQAVDDEIDEASPHTCQITHAYGASEADEYASLSNSVLNVNVQDDDTAGFIISNLSGNTSESNDMATFTVALNSEPTESVTIAVSSSDTREGTVSPTSLTFSEGNWDIPQTVTVRGVDDDKVDGSVHYTIITSADMSTKDIYYNGLNPDDVNVINFDNDPGIVIRQSLGSTKVMEGSTTDSYEIKLSTIPTNPVEVTITPEEQLDLGEDAGYSIIYYFEPDVTALNPQRVEVTAVDDMLEEGSHTGMISHSATSEDANYKESEVTFMVEEIETAELIVNITDNDTVGVTVTESEGSTTLTEEGGTDNYTLVLNTMPTAKVTLTLTPDQQCTVNQTSLTFTTENWNIPQTVTITATDDNDAEYLLHSCVIRHSVSGGDYDGISIARVTAQVTDNDQTTLASESSGLQALSSTMKFAVKFRGEGSGRVEIRVQEPDSVRIREINCSSSEKECQYTLNTRSQVELSVIADQGSEFVSWVDNNYCNDNKLSLTRHYVCTAYLRELAPTVKVEDQPEVEPVEPPVEDQPLPVIDEVEMEESEVPTYYTLTVMKIGDGNGTVTFNEEVNINCDNHCTQDYLSETEVPLTVNVETDSTFVGWEGDCEGTGESIRVTLTKPLNCQAKFDLAPVMETEPTVLPMITSTVVSDTPTKPCPKEGYLDWVYNANGATINHLTIRKNGNLSNAIIDGVLKNKGWASNLIITSQGQLSGGTVSGTFYNKGLMKDFEFVGESITNGYFEGNITNTSKIGGYLKDIHLKPDAHVEGGNLVGHITGTGESSARALLESLTIQANSEVSNVIIGPKVKIKEKVTLTEVELRGTTVIGSTLIGRVINTKDGIFQDVKLAANAHVSGGQWGGYIEGLAPTALLEAAKIQPGSQIVSVILGNNVELSDDVYLGDDVTFLVHQEYLAKDGKKIKPLPILGNALAFSAQGEPLTIYTKVAGGISLNGNEEFQIEVTSEPHDEISILGNLFVDLNQINQVADIVMYAAYTPPEAPAESEPLYYMFVPGGEILPWEGNPLTLVPFQEDVHLNPVHPVEGFQGQLAPGIFKFSFGYRLKDGSLVLSQDGMIKVERFE